MKIKKTITLVLATALTVCNVPANVFRQNFGGSDEDKYNSVTAVPDGVVTVGNSSIGSFGNGDWTDVEMKGKTDPVIVKYDNSGNVIWKKNFNGIGLAGYPNTALSYFNSVATVADGVVVAGYAQPNAFGSGDWTGVAGKGAFDAILVKFDYEGNVVWKKVFGGNQQSGWDYYNAVTTTPDGIVTVGYSNQRSFNGGDLAGIAGKGSDDAVIVKYDQEGNILWKKNFGGAGPDIYTSVTAVSDGIIAAGRSEIASYDTGDWTGVEGKGLWDAIIVKYDNNGNVLWKKSFGGAGNDYYNAVTEVADGVVAVGFSGGNSFGVGDWENIEGRGGQDAIIVKYDNDGNIVWQNILGGSGSDTYNSVKAVTDCIIAAGHSQSDSFDSGDFADIAGKGGNDAVIVKYDNDGNVIQIRNFGGNGDDTFNSVTTLADEFIAAGMSDAGSFDNGDFTGIMGKGLIDAVIVKYDSALSPPSGIGEVNAAKLDIYPNPTTGMIYTGSESNIKVYNAQGELLMDAFDRQIDLAGYPSGLYLLQVNGKTAKVIKE